MNKQESHIFVRRIANFGDARSTNNQDLIGGTAKALNEFIEQVIAREEKESAVKELMIGTLQNTINGQDKLIEEFKMQISTLEETVMAIKLLAAAKGINLEWVAVSAAVDTPVEIAAVNTAD